MSAVCPNGHTSEAEDYCDTCGSPIVTSAEPTPSGTAAGASATPSSAGSSLDLSPSAPPAEPGGSGDSGGPGAGRPGRRRCSSAPTARPRTPTARSSARRAATTSRPAPCPVTRLPARATSPTPSPTPRPSLRSVRAGSEPPPPPALLPRGASDTSETPESFDWLAEVWVDPDWYQTQEAEDPCPSPGLPTIMPLRHRSVLLGRVSTSKNTRPEIDLSSDPGVSRRHAQLTTDGTRWFVEDLGSSNGTFVGPAAGPLPATSIAVGPKTELSDDDRLYVGAWDPRRRSSRDPRRGRGVRLTTEVGTRRGGPHGVPLPLVFLFARVPLCARAPLRAKRIGHSTGGGPSAHLPAGNVNVT